MFTFAIVGILLAWVALSLPVALIIGGAFAASGSMRKTVVAPPTLAVASAN